MLIKTFNQILLSLVLGLKEGAWLLNASLNTEVLNDPNWIISEFFFTELITLLLVSDFTDTYSCVSSA